MNTVRFTEYLKLGLIHSNYDQYAYRGLKCPERNIHTMDYSGQTSRPTGAMAFCNASHYRHILAIGYSTGCVRIHNTNNSENPTHDFRIDPYPIHDLMWLEDERTLVTAASKYTPIIWDLERAQMICSMSGHLGCVRTIDRKPGCNDVFVSGDEYGVIMQWDLRCPRPTGKFALPDKVIRDSHLNFHPFLSCFPNMVTSIVYQYPEAFISCSLNDRNIKVWDARKSYSAFNEIPTPLYTINKGLAVEPYSGYTSLAISPCRLKLYALCTDGTIYRFNIGKYNSTPTASYNSVKGSSDFTKIHLSPNGKFLSSGSVESKGYIWSVDNTKQHLATLEGHSAKVNQVIWCKDTPLKLASCSFDGTYRIWQTLPDTDIEPTPSRSFVKYHLPQKPQFRRYFGSHVKPSLKSGMTMVELPNYIVDRETPRRSPRIKSTMKSRARECNWLKKLSIRTPPLKTCRIKRTARRRSTTAKESLLKYFTKPVEASVSDR